MAKRAWARPDGRARLFQADSRDLRQIPSGSVGVILTSPPYWVSNRGRQAAEHDARRLAVGFGREWRRVLVADGDLWLVLGDRHNGREWVGVDGLVAGRLRGTGSRRQSKCIWAETGSRERWDNRINHLLRFARAGRHVHPTAATLCWMLPLPRTHPASIWRATPQPVLRALILQSRRRGPVLDPFCGAGTVGRGAVGRGREWIGIERDPRRAELPARRLGMTRAGT